MPSQRRTIPKLLWALDCGHLGAAVANTTESKLYCIYHQEVRPIIGIHVFEWHASCAHDGNCRFSAWAGTSKMNAASNGDKHARTHPSHSPFIRLDYVMRPAAVAEQKDRIKNGTMPNTQ
jgi:hypothetical protein